MRSCQGFTFFHQDPGWDPKGQPKGQKAKRLTCRKTRASFYYILWNLIRTSLFPPGSMMGSQRTTKATKREMSGRQKNLNIVYWILRGPFKTSLFSHQDPGWDPKGWPKGRTEKRLTSRKTQATFYWILWGPVRASLFPPGSRMGSQGTTKGEKSKTSDM